MTIPDILSNFFKNLTPEQSKAIFTIIMLTLFVIIVFIIFAVKAPSINSKARKVGDGQHGSARWITKREKNKAFLRIKYDVKSWRKGKNLPSAEQAGIIVDMKKRFGKITAYVEHQDIHVGMYAGTGAGKTSFFLYPNIEFACACGMSFFTTDTKGDLYRNSGYVAQKYYGYNISILDLRNPIISSGNNILSQVNKYMDLSRNMELPEVERIKAAANCEKYAHLTADNIINSDKDNNYGANKYFYDAAKSLLTSVILLVSEFGKGNERHIASVFTLLTELLEYVPYGNSREMRFNGLLRMLPTEHRAKLFATTAIAGADQSKLSVVTTALSKLTSFIDTENEQMLCFENDINIERFCTEKSAIFVVLPEEDPTKYFLVSLLTQQFYRECLIYADKNGGKLAKRALFFMDEIGTVPKISSFTMMFSAARSRNLIFIPILQAPSQLEDTYGEKSAETINANLGCVIYGGFSPEGKLAAELSKSLGNMTVSTNTVSRTPMKLIESNIQSSMTGKPLISESALRLFKTGEFIVRRTGYHPFRSRFKLFTEWGISFPEQYDPEIKQLRKVSYLSADELERRIEKSMIDKALKEQTEKDYNEKSHHKDADNTDEQHFFSDFDADEV